MGAWWVWHASTCEAIKYNPESPGWVTDFYKVCLQWPWELNTNTETHCKHTKRKQKYFKRTLCWTQSGHVTCSYGLWLMKLSKFCLCISCLCTWLSEVRQRFAKQWNLAVQSQATNEFSCLITTALQSNTQHNLFQLGIMQMKMQPAHQEQFGIRYLAQGHLDMKTKGINPATFR